MDRKVKSLRVDHGQKPCLHPVLPEDFHEAATPEEVDEEPPDATARKDLGQENRGDLFSMPWFMPVIAIYIILCWIAFFVVVYNYL